MSGSLRLMYGDDVAANDNILYGDDVAANDNILYADPDETTLASRHVYRLIGRHYPYDPSLTGEEVWDLTYADMQADTWGAVVPLLRARNDAFTAPASGDHYAECQVRCAAYDSSALNGRSLSALDFYPNVNPSDNEDLKWEIGVVTGSVATPTSTWTWASSETQMSGTGNGSIGADAWYDLDNIVVLDDYLFLICRFDASEWTYTRATNIDEPNFDIYNIGRIGLRMLIEP